MAQPSLTEISNRYASDKGTIGPSDAWTAHNYTDIYEAYLSAYRMETITLLEIGLGVTGDRWDARIVQGKNSGGASIKMWQDYFPNGRIFGIDINAASYLDTDRVSTFVVDQSSVEELDSFWGSIGKPSFDFIIDDGSHRPDHQQISLGFLFPKLKPGGLYFIEDLLPNGRGDNASGRMACDEVCNTRSVLRQFPESGTFLQPNATGAEKELANQIADVCFHVPRIVAGRSGILPPRIRRMIPFLGRARKRQVKWVQGSEKLCVLRKK